MKYTIVKKCAGWSCVGSNVEILTINGTTIYLNDCFSYIWTKMGNKIEYDDLVVQLSDFCSGDELDEILEKMRDKEIIDIHDDESILNAMFA